MMLQATDVLNYTCELPDGSGRRASTLAIFTVCLTAFVSTLDLTVVNVALPAISADLQVGIGSLQWVVDAYNITLAGFLLLGAGLGDRFTHRRVFLLGVALFLLGSLLASAAPNAGSLIAARAVMGLGAAWLLTPALALLATLCHGQERTRALGLWAVLSSLGLASGPILGGVLIQFLSWRAVFLVVVPVLVVILAIGVRTLPKVQTVTSSHVDLPGSFLSVATMVLVLGALIEAPTRGWGSPLVLCGLILGLLAGAAFVVWELRTTTPMIDLRALRRRTIAAVLVAFFATYLSAAGTLFLVPQQLMLISGFGALAVGLVLLPLAIVDCGFGAKAAALAKARSPRWAVGLGMTGMAAGFVVLALSVTGPAAMYTAVGVVLGTMLSAVGWGLIVPTGSTLLLGELPYEKASTGSGASMLARFTGSSAGIAIMGTILASIYSAATIGAFEQAGVPKPAMAIGPQATETAVATLPPAQQSAVEPLTIAAFEHATAATYLAGAGIVLVCLVIFWALSRSRAERTQAVTAAR